MIERDRQTPAWPQRVAGFLHRALVIELRIYESLWRFLARRPLVAQGAAGFHYHRPVLTVLIIFIALSAVEIPIIDAIVHPFPPVRIALLILGIWGLTWMLGLLCAFITRPHTVGPEGIHVREGLEIDIPVPWAAFASMRLAKHVIDPSDPDRPRGRVLEDDGHRICALRVSNETNLEIELEAPLLIRLPGNAPKGGWHEVTKIRFWADDPTGFLDAVRDVLRGASCDAS